MELHSDSDEDLPHVVSAQVKPLRELRSALTVSVSGLNRFATARRQFREAILDCFDCHRFWPFLTLGLPFDEQLDQFPPQDALSASIFAQFVPHDVRCNPVEPLAKVTCRIKRLSFAVGGKERLLGDVVGPIGVDP